MNLDLSSKGDLSDLVYSERFKMTVPFPLSCLKMAKSLDRLPKIRILLRSIKYCFKSRSKQLYVKDLKAFLTLAFVKKPSFLSELLVDVARARRGFGGRV